MHKRYKYGFQKLKAALFMFFNIFQTPERKHK